MDDGEDDRKVVMKVLAASITLPPRRLHSDWTISKKETTSLESLGVRVRATAVH